MGIKRIFTERTPADDWWGCSDFSVITRRILIVIVIVGSGLFMFSLFGLLIHKLLAESGII